MILLALEKLAMLLLEQLLRSFQAVQLVQVVQLALALVVEAVEVGHLLQLGTLRDPLVGMVVMAEMLVLLEETLQHLPLLLLVQVVLEAVVAVAVER
jgi:hypothetical protein